MKNSIEFPKSFEDIDAVFIIDKYGNIDKDKTVFYNEDILYDLFY